MDDRIGQIIWLPIDKLFPHPDNPRKDLGDLKEIADSIKVRGVLQNLTVVPRVDADTEQEIATSPAAPRNDNGVGSLTIEQLREMEWTVVIGHRRHAAGKLVGLTELPCVVSDMDPKEQFETMMIENVQRNALTVYEQAKGFQMMLEMGSSVEDVAKKTGFSATTIRRRAQLAQLDEEKFKKTERRGAALEDYLKLSKIEDPAQRDKVLEKIGTAEFNNSFRKAMEEQKFRAFFKQLLQALRSADWLTEVQKGGYDGSYEYLKTYGKNNQQIPERPDDVKPKRYIFVVYDESVVIYRKRGREKKGEEQKLLEQLQADLQGINAEFDTMRKRFFEMRKEFVKNFSEFNNNQLEIEAFAARVFAELYLSGINMALLSELTGIKAYRPKGAYSDKLQEKEWNSLLFRLPQKALLCATYAMLDNKNMAFSACVYESRMHINVPKWNDNKKLAVLYQGLKSLGYEMAQEEVQLQEGTHPLFLHAQQLIETYKEDVKRAKAKASKK